MKLTSKPKATAPAGTHTAIFYGIVDLGTHFDEMSGSTKRRVRLSFELCDELMEDGRPFAISKEYTASSNEKSTLVQHLKAWTGLADFKDFDLNGLLGKACNVTVSRELTKQGSEYAKLVALAPLKKTETAPPQVNPIVLFEMDIDSDTLDTTIFNTLPEFLKEKIMVSPEYIEIVARRNGLRPAQQDYSDTDDELPPVDSYASDVLSV